MSLFDELDHPRQIAGLNSFALMALGHWEGEFDQVSLVKYRENAVYSAVRSDGERIALRIHRDGYHHEAALQSELDGAAGRGRHPGTAGNPHARRHANDPGAL
jgi:hypothetical protein